MKYGYTPFGEMALLTRFKGSNENSFSFTYDRIGRQIQATDDLGQISSSAYEPFCVGQTGTSARGIRQKTNFDVRCLLREVETGDIDPNNALNILNPRESYTWEYDELGRMIESSKSKVVYGQSVFGLADYADIDRTEYDELDRVVRVVRTPDGQSEYEFLFEYDEEGNLTKTTESNDRVTEYSYYRDNLLKEVTVKRPSEADRVFTYSYDLAGRLAKIVYPSETGIEAIFRSEADLLSSDPTVTGFDPNGNIRFLRYQKNDSQLTPAQALIRRFEWTYDESNNRDSMLDVTPGEAIKWEYGMDWLDRLVSVKRASASTVAALPAATLQREYEFDESDNRTYFDDHLNGKTYHYVYKSYNDGGTVRYSDQLKEIREASTSGTRDPNNFNLLESFEHDLDGNMTKRTLAATSQVTDYDWTDFDRLKKVTSNGSVTLQEANYDVGGLRERKTDKNGDTFVEYALGISTSASEPTTGASPPPSISYISGHMILGAEIDGEFVYHLGDALSSIRDVYGYDSGAQEWTVVRSFEFDEYGNQISTSGTGTSSPKTWIGGMSVNDDTADSGMFNMGHRNYAGGVLGRFISRDPIGFAGGLNLYGYPTNPISRTDPSGLDSGGGWGENIWDGILYAIGAEIPEHYGDGHKRVEDLKKSKGVNRARLAYFKKKQDKCNPEALTDFGVPFGPNQVIWATLNNDATWHYLGHHHVAIRPLTNGRVGVIVDDTKSAPSLLYQSGFPEVPAEWKMAPLHNQTQHYMWTEEAPCPANIGDQTRVPDYRYKNPVVESISSFIYNQLQKAGYPF